MLCKNDNVRCVLLTENDPDVWQRYELTWFIEESLGHSTDHQFKLFEVRPIIVTGRYDALEPV
ncbi:hypothetical protein [Robertmurraya kyonggiensis]|uniref:Uncharacterized protein n=1 Tax=Robertmurraya kyonggiensis TaxID=1037680 RepID=A0A4V5P350_9BACI|nr:hypothetical protein [Robertmurraya kyonggiensis]TKC11447.1 hypothetical protein FA727_23870 [Robertmurraya kyonggiensis]